MLSEINGYRIRYMFYRSFTALEKKTTYFQDEHVHDRIFYVQICILI